MSETYKAIGILHEIFDEQRISEKFSKREFVLEIQDGQYPQHIKFQTVQDKTALLDGKTVGQSVEVAFNLRGRPFDKNGQTMYFTSLEAWKIEAAGGAQPAAAPAANGFKSANTNPALRQQPGAQIQDLNPLPF
ncbi:MAG: hypothetical protein NVS3B25_19130 [Hymenobacter sp.]